MNRLLPKEINFDVFLKDILNGLEKHDKIIKENPGYKLSAVMMLIMEKNGEPHLLLTKRSDLVRTHKGEISLPGGKKDLIDENILETAFRETFEEVGVLREEISYLGQFDDYLSIFGYHISTFVGMINYPFEYNFCETEISDYIEVPLSLFENLKYDKLEYYDNGEEKFPMYYYYFNSQKIWGLTARIVTDFAQKILVNLK